MAGVLRGPRSRGALTGALLVLLGIWGGLIAFVGPYFHYAYTPDKAWTYTTGRLYLEILPGAGALLGGLILMAARGRHSVLFGSLLAIASGAWFALGNIFAPLWTVANPAGGPASTGTVMRIAEQIGFFSGLGIVIVMIAAMVAGRITAVRSVPADDRTVAVPATREPVDETEVVETS